ncbi:MAG: alpha/beta hydrolase, partial [Proteobacteria bacterium]|nr:alpha/beta hydrolase [Pseudomonadota bacterium]
GYSVLLIDLPGHGESTGDKITFGAREGAGVTAALAFLRRELPTERIGIIGTSMGAAALVLAHPQPPADAVILESMYPTIDEAVRDRLTIRFGPAGARLAPLLLWQLPLQLGVAAESLRPIDNIAALGSPVLVAAGTSDEDTTWAETLRIFSAALPPKELWAVAGAAHIDLYEYSGKEYEAKVLQFFSRYLRHEA